MSDEARVFRGASWLALFKLISQLFSWVMTVLIARILVPADYGLMEMATVISSYAFFFSELGVGAAIVQRPTIAAKELSSVFWFGMGMSGLLALTCFPLAYVTAAVFHEPRVIPITMTTSVLFLVGGLQIVPLNLLKKRMQFKDVGFIEMTGVIVSSIAMLVIARLGGGVWTLIGGHIIRASVNLVQVYLRARWLPGLHFAFREASSYLRFGVLVAINQSLFFLYNKSDKLFGGRAFASTTLGYYSYAMSLASIPTEKIVVLINQVSFSAFSQIQDDREKFSRLYLIIMKVTATIVLPIFVGGFLVGGDIVRIVLNEKWYPMIPFFEFLCLAQIVSALGAVNNFVHTAQGKPSWPLWSNGLLAVFMPLSFAISVRHGQLAILVPWFTTYLVISGGWILFTIRSIGISLSTYLRNIAVPLVGTAAMLAAMLAVRLVLGGLGITLPLAGLLAVNTAIAAATYAATIWSLDRALIERLRSLMRRKIDDD